jgi:hypothetical protein
MGGLSASLANSDAYGMGCLMDGMPTNCSLAMRLLNNGTAVRCPNDDCGSGVNSFHASGDGWSGYLPAGISYVGDGFILNSDWTGGDSEKVSFDDLEFGSLAQGATASFTSSAQRRKSRTKGRKTPFSTVIAEIGGREDPIKVLPGFDAGDEQRLRQTLEDIKKDTDCAAAFADAVGIDPKGLTNRGRVFGSAFLLGNPADNSQAGITEYGRAKYAGIRGSYDIQAVTLKNWSNSRPETVDSRARIFLNPSAFRNGKYSLREVLVHELLHAAGWMGEPVSFWGRLRGKTDLSHYAKYDEIIAACK